MIEIKDTMDRYILIPIVQLSSYKIWNILIKIVLNFYRLTTHTVQWMSLQGRARFLMCGGM